VTPSSGNRFEDFFADDAYVGLKNHLYNYLLRRRAVRQCLQSKKGELILTFPHRRSYFATDDRFVNHFRRYEMGEMKKILAEAGLKTLEIQKVLGPLEKITMMSVISLIALLGRFRKGKQDDKRGQRVQSSGFLITLFVWLNRLYCVPVWLDVRLAPRSFSSVLLIRAVWQP
jgi:hypothetical protein